MGMVPVAPPPRSVADRKNVALLFSDELQVIHSISL